MKFSSETLSVLKNFSTINPSIVFKPGSVVRTISPQKTVMAAATIGETVETQAGVYDLSRFLSTLALFENPDVMFGQDRFTIKGGASTLSYTYTSESLMVTPPEKDIVVPDPEVSVNIKWQDIESVRQAAGVLNCPRLLSLVMVVPLLCQRSTAKHQRLIIIIPLLLKVSAVIHLI